MNCPVCQEQSAAAVRLCQRCGWEFKYWLAEPAGAERQFEQDRLERFRANWQARILSEQQRDRLDSLTEQLELAHQELERYRQAEERPLRRTGVQQTAIPPTELRYSVDIQKNALVFKDIPAPMELCNLVLVGNTERLPTTKDDGRVLAEWPVVRLSPRELICGMPRSPNAMKQYVRLFFRADADARHYRLMHGPSAKMLWGLYS